MSEMVRAKHSPTVWIAGRDNWLANAGTLAVGEVMWIYDGRGLAWRDALPALVAQYGAGQLQCGNHGQAFFVKRLREIGCQHDAS